MYIDITYDISLDSLAGPISDRVVNPVALCMWKTIVERIELHYSLCSLGPELTLFQDLVHSLQGLPGRGRPSFACL